jgi:hypothetical protein
MPNIVKNRGRFSSAASMSDTATITIGAGTADQDFVIFSAPTKCVVDSFSIIANASSTAQTAANHMNFQFINVTQSENLLATAHSLAGADLTADVAKVISTDQNSIVEQNDVIQFKNANTGTGGVTQFSGIVQISTRYRPA